MNGSVSRFRFATVAVAMLVLSLPALAQQSPYPRNLDSHLQELLRQRAALGTQAASKIVGLPATDGQDRVHVRVLLDGTRSLEEVATLLSQAGSNVEPHPDYPNRRELVASIPVNQLVNIATSAGVQSILLYYMPVMAPPVPHPSHIQPISPEALRPNITYTGQSPSQASTPIGVTSLNTAYPALDGTGMTIGIISDTYDTCTGCTKRAVNDIASNNLPGVGNPAGNTTPVVVVAEGTSSFSDEGRAMMQLVYNMAPKAKYCFATGFSNFEANVAALYKSVASGGLCGANVIIDDVGFQTTEGDFTDQTPPSQAVIAAVAAGVTYLSSAGNSRGLYDGTWNGISDATVRAGTYGNLNFTTVPSAATAGGYQNFSTTGGQQISFSVTIPANTGTDSNPTFVLQWNDLFTTTGITSDYNLLVFDVNGVYQPALSSTDTNTATGAPVESITPPKLATVVTYQIVISAAAAPGAAQRLRIIPTKDIDSYTQTGLSLNPEIPAIFGHPAAPGVIGTAAYGWSVLTTPQDYSSGGAFTNYFDTNSNRLVTPEVRQQPLIAGLDNVDTTFFGQDTDGDGFPNFSGTSAAAPTAGAVAALVIQAGGGTVSPANVITYMKGSASHSGLWANKDGYGYVNALKAVNLAKGANTQAASTTVVTSSANPTVTTASVTFTATVSSTAGARTGNVTFFDGMVSLGISALTANVATLTTSALTLGAHTITANYTGDDSNLQSSGTLTQTISAPVLAVTGYPNPDHIGTSNNVTVTAKDLSGNTLTSFTGAVTLTSSDAAATLPAAYTYAGGDAGVHVFAVSLNTGGTQTITATSGTSVGAQTGIFVDSYIWLHNTNQTFTRLAETGVTSFTTGSVSNASALHSVGFDNAGNVWSINNTSNGVSKLTPAAGAISNTYTGGGVSTPVSLAVDGSGQIWVTSGTNRLSIFTNAGATGSPATGYQPAISTSASALTSPGVVAIDISGSLWIANGTGNTVTKVFGAAAPTVSPLATGVSTNTLGTKP